MHMLYTYVASRGKILRYVDSTVRGFHINKLRDCLASRLQQSQFTHYLVIDLDKQLAHNQSFLLNIFIMLAYIANMFTIYAGIFNADLS